MNKLRTSDSQFVHALLTVCLEGQTPYIRTNEIDCRL